MDEWDHERNIGVDPATVTYGSHKKVWWKCVVCGHRWPAVVKNRTSNGIGCPECGKIKKIQSYMQTRASDNPPSEDLIKQIHPTLNEGVDLTKISSGSNQSLIWKCLVDENHKPWPARVVDRTAGQGCPACGLIKQVQSFKTLAAQKNPLSEDLVKEIHPTLNEGVDLTKISSGSDQFLIWKCLVDENHKPWPAKLNNRSNGQGCPACSESGGEKKVAKILTEKGIVFIREYTDPSCQNKRPLPFDFAIFQNGKVIAMIEYHGAQHYIPITFGSKKKSAEEIFKGIQHRDLIKKQWCFDKNIHFLEIPYTDFENIENIIIEFLNKL